MEGSEKDLRYQMCKIDDGVVNVAAVLCNPALLEPHLKMSIDPQEEFGGEFFVEVFLCLEDRSLSFDHRLQGAETLGADAKLAKKDIIRNGAHFYLHYHVVYARLCFQFLFVGCFDLVNCHPFALGKDKLEKEVAILLLVHTDGFDFPEGDRAVVTWCVST